MMGRGTRLCKDLFGAGLDKENFYVFDYCQNFEFFAENPEGIEGASQESLGKKIFKQRLNLLLLLQQPDIPTGDGLQRLRGSIEDTLEVTLHLAGLPAELPQEDETAKRFDLLLLNLQLALLEKSTSFARNRDKVMEIAARLEGKGTIPMVAQQMELILDLQTESYWAGITLPLLEDVRLRFRDLIKFLDKGEAASEAFGEFLHNTTYSATQIRFIDQVVSYLTQNGTMDPGLLYEPPFTDIHNEGLDGVFGDAGATNIIHLLQDNELRAAA